MKKNNKKAFTLVELLVVIAILAILATVSVVGYSSFTKQAKKSVAEQEMAQVKTILLADWLDGFVGETSVSNTTSITKVATGYQTTANFDALIDVFGDAKVDGSSVSGKYEETTSGTSGAKEAGGKYYKETSDSVAQSGKKYYTYTAAGTYTEETAKDYNAELDGAVSSGSDVPSDYETKVGNSAVDTTLTADEADAYNAKLDGAVKSGDVKPASASEVTGLTVAKAADENWAYGQALTFVKDASNIITKVQYAADNGYFAVWSLSDDSVSASETALTKGTNETLLTKNA